MTSQQINEQFLVNILRAQFVLMAGSKSRGEGLELENVSDVTTWRGKQLICHSSYLSLTFKEVHQLNGVRFRESLRFYFAENAMKVLRDKIVYRSFYTSHGNDI